MENETTGSKKLGSVFTDAFCETLLYRIKVPQADFKKAEFLEQVFGASRNVRGEKAKTTDQGGVICSSREENFHVHLDWNPGAENKIFRMVIGFHATFRPPDKGEKEPFAEEIVPWLASYFSNETLDVEAHADFEFPTEKRKTKLLLLPLTAKLGPEDTEVLIDGMSVSLPSKPSGLERVWLSQGEGTYSVHLKARRMLNLKQFDLKQELSDLMKALEILLEKV